MDLLDRITFSLLAGHLNSAILYSSMMGVQQVFFEVASKRLLELSLDPLTLDLLNPTLSCVCTLLPEQDNR
jgi:hypothetical protein